MKPLMLLFLDIGGGELIFGIVICVLLFLALRELFCWYYKINEGLRELKQLNANIKLLVEAQGKTPWENNGKRPSPAPVKTVDIEKELRK